MDIVHFEHPDLVLDSSRRLTGPSLVWAKSGAILDVFIENRDLTQVIECWYRQIDRVLDLIEWPNADLTHRQFENGFNLLIAAPIDQLYSATLALETAWHLVSGELLDSPIDNVDDLILTIKESMLEERAVELTNLQQAASEHSVDFLVDDDSVSIGHGTDCNTWPLDEIPAIDQINWAEVKDVPVAMITGTNGKSTSVRILDGIARTAGVISGVTSTDFVRVGDDVLDTGDYSGPGGARLLLRDKRLELAFLEVARGGILRRGLPLQRAKAALITNVGRDHLGQYGVNTLEALIEVKFAVRQALTDDAVLVLNADDSGISDYITRNPRLNICWFSLDKNNALIQQQLNQSGRCCYADEGELYYFDGQVASLICAIEQIPMTLNGAALHNVCNALGAIGVSRAIGFSNEQIGAGLTQFHSNQNDNPGRLNSFECSNGSKVLIDFAHNAHSVSAVADTVKRMPARQKWALCGSAGDRSNEEIAAIAEGLCAINPDNVVVVEVEQYLRGREDGEVSQILQQAFRNSGLSDDQIHLAPSSLAGVQLALAKMQKDDLGLFLVLEERDEIIELVSNS